MTVKHSILFILFFLSFTLGSCSEEDVCSAENFIGQWEGQIVCNTSDDFIRLQISQLSEDSLSIQYESITLLTVKEACIITASYSDGVRTINLSATKNDTLLSIQLNDTNFLTKSCSGDLQRN